MMRAEKRVGGAGGRLALTAALWFLLGAGRAVADPVTLKATLILASNKPAPIDPRLERVEYQLRRIFGFEHYEHYGEGSVTTELPAKVTLDLGHGYSLEIDAKSAGDKKIRAGVRWRQGEKNLLSTAVNMKKGVPTILGGPPHEGGTLIVTLVPR